MREDGDNDIKVGLLRQLVMLALADGAISESEHCHLLKMAKRIGYDLEDAHRLISSKVAEVGFPMDTLMEGHVERLARIVHHRG